MLQLQHQHHVHQYHPHEQHQVQVHLQQQHHSQPQQQDGLTIIEHTQSHTVPLIVGNYFFFFLNLFNVHIGSYTLTKSNISGATTHETCIGEL